MPPTTRTAPLPSPTALADYFDFDEIVAVLGILADKDARGIVETLAPAG